MLSHHPAIFLFRLLILPNGFVPAGDMKLFTWNWWLSRLLRIAEPHFHFRGRHGRPGRDVSIFQVHIMCSNHLPVPVDHDFLAWPLQKVCLATSCGIQRHILCWVTAPLWRKVTW